MASEHPLIAARMNAGRMFRGGAPLVWDGPAAGVRFRLLAHIPRTVLLRRHLGRRAAVRWNLLPAPDAHARRSGKRTTARCRRDIGGRRTAATARGWFGPRALLDAGLRAIVDSVRRPRRVAFGDAGAPRNRMDPVAGETQCRRGGQRTARGSIATPACQQ